MARGADITYDVRRKTEYRGTVKRTGNSNLHVFGRRMCGKDTHALFYSVSFYAEEAEKLVIERK